MKKRNKYFLKEKEYIRLKKELEKNTYAQYHLGWVDLPEPRFRGWIAKLEARQDIKNREDSWVFEGIVELFGTKTFARKIEWFDWNRSKKDKKWITYQRPSIRSINQYDYDRLVPQAKKWFTKNTYSSNWKGDWYYCTIPNFYYEIVYKKDFITKIKLSDSILEQEEAELRSKINKDFYNINKFPKGAPKGFRKKLNRRQRAKSKIILHKILKEGYELEFEDHYKGASRDWW